MSRARAHMDLSVAGSTISTTNRHRAGLKRLLLVCALVAASLGVSAVHPTVAGAATPTFVQAGANEITSGRTNSLAFSTGNTAGNLVVVSVLWSNASAVTVADSRGNTYTAATTRAAWNSNSSEQVFYATNVAGGANTVTATFGSNINQFGIIYIHEYSNATALDATSVASGTSAAMSTGTISTTAAGDLLFAFGGSTDQVTAAGAGYVTRSTAYDNRSMDTIAGGAGTYSATATQNGRSWVMQVVAFKASGGSSDTTPPTVALTAPADASTVNATVTVSANAADNIGVVGVQFLLDGNPLGAEDTTSPYSVSWDTTTATNASHTLTARARDAAGNTTTSTARTVTVNNTTSDTTPPTVALTAPADASTVNATVTVSANAADNIGVVGVQFLLDGNPLGAEDTTSPYSVSWDTTTATNASHSLTARARDAAGNTTTSTARTVTVNNTTSGAPIVAGYAFNDGAGTNAVDASGHGVNGTLVNGPAWVTGKNGGALDFDGTNDYVSLGNPTALQLTGSMTISAWINSDAFPADDAAIVSKRGSTGYQLDTTIDNGPRTIGFKLNSGTGANMFRYGATAMQTGVWYHIAGVYNATTQTLDVYLNGQLDDGPLQGTVTASQQNSTQPVYIGQRPSGGFFHNGRVDDVRIYNRALTAAEINTDMNTPLANAGGDTTPPTVALTAPADGSTVNATVTVSANAADNTGVVGVQFLLDGNPLGAEDTTSPYSVSWNTTTATNASHTLTARARDAAGNTTTSTARTVTVNNTTSDTTPPTVALTAPADASTVNATVTVSANAADNIGVVGVQFLLDGNPLGAEDTTSPYSVSWDTTTATNASHTLTARARDAAGNTTTSTARTVTVNNTTSDTTPPTVALTAPADASTVNATVTVSANAADNIGVVGVQFLLDGNPLGAEDTTSPYSVSWDTTTATNASHSLTARARDAAGNTTTSTARTVTVNNTTSGAPIVAGYAFNDGAGTNAVDASGHGVNGTLVNGPAWVTGKNGGALDFDGTNDYVSLGNPTALQLTGSMTISAWINSDAFPADDAAIVSKRGSTGYQLDTTIDNGPRTIGFKLNSGTGANMFRYGATAMQTGVWYHIAGVYNATTQTLDVYLNGQLDDGPLQGTVTASQQNSTQPVYIGQRPSGGFFHNGRVDDVRIYNRALTAAEINTDMNTPLANAGGDTTPPTVALTAPADGSTVNATVTVSANAADNTGVVGVQFLLDGNPLGAEDTTSPYSVSWNTTTATNASHTLTARARDAAGNTTTSTARTVTVNNTTSDTTPPSQPTNLVATAVSGAQINLSWTASTDNVGVTGYRVSRNGTQIATPTGTSYSDTGLSPSTTYNYSVVAVDAAGNTSQPATATTTTSSGADTVAPTIAFTAPSQNALVSDIVTITADAADNVGVVGVQFYVDNVAAGVEDTATPYGYVWDTRTATNGAHTLTARARDAAGNATTSEAIAVNVANTNAFQNDILATGLNLPTSIAFLPDGRMLVTELPGTIKVLSPPYTTVSPTPFLQLTNVGNDGYAGLQQGIFSLVLDPNFATNHYYYIFYTMRTPNRDRLSRFTADSTNTTTIAGSELVLYQDPQDANTEHHGGAIMFGNDGKLYFTTGEHFNAGDAQLLSTPRGKLHRINPDGTIPTDNPFYDGGGPNVDSIWALGLRNPYRAYYDAPTGRMYIGDVGGNDPNNSQEEVDLGVRGANYGWPNSEGPCGSGCTSPLYSYSHAGRDASITGGFVYHGSQFPASYQGSYFFADYAENWIRRLTFDANGNVNGVFNFEPIDGSVDGPYGDIVYLTEGPDGALYYLDLGYSDVSGTFGVSKIRRISYASSNLAPTAIASALPTSGLPPLTVSFSSAGSVDPESQPLTYSWTFGDGATSTQANPTHTYATAGPYSARLAVSDGVNTTQSTPIAISVGVTPTATISSPTDGSFFIAGDVIHFSGDATDPTDGVLPASAFTWTIDFLHDGHVHPGSSATGIKSGDFAIPTSGHDFSGNTRYRISLTVVNSHGLSDTKVVIIWPHKVNLSVATVPSGLTLYLDGIAHVTPFVYADVPNFNHTIEARDQSVGGVNYTFASWSDGGAQQHTITVPAADQSYTATYQVAATPQVPTFVQVNSATPQTTNQTTVTVPYLGAQTGSNTNIVVVGFNNTTSNIVSVTDTKGNAYQLAAPLVRGVGISQAIYYAKNIAPAAAGTNTVTVTFDGQTAFPDIRVTEYSGLDPVAPFDVAASQTGSAASATSPNVTTSFAQELIFGAGTTQGAFTGGAAGFTTRIITPIDADIVVDRNVTTGGSYNAGAVQSAGANWVMQVATFRAAGQ